ncbi:hypothetical protein HCU64_13335 [Methylobacterium sp. C25]|uniref:hypothetical protein n=1 Tax=Methylobacterium sp. C25 TaxID=2721622 RepID=UPI001F3275BD|nr:hypothetical protein [Methylobacterium sp. C25]MCE4224741.1 hypothetical protein [Methylobacterium sp. C25]
MFTFSETAPGQWQWSFAFGKHVLAHAEEAYASRGKAMAAAEVFARGVGQALVQLIGHR